MRPGYSYYLQGTGYDDGSPEAAALIFEIMEKQSSILTYTHTMEVLTLLALCGIPLTLFVRSRANPSIQVQSQFRRAYSK